MRFMRRRSFPTALLAVLIFSTINAFVLPLLGDAIQPVVPVTQITPLTGKAFIGRLTDPDLSDHERPTEARLYLIESKRGTALHHFDGACKPSYACAWLNALLDANYPFATYEVRTPLGPGGSLHQEISDQGAGRYSVWRGHVYFSLPSESTIVNAKRLEVEPVSLLQASLQFAGGLFGWVRDLAALTLLLMMTGPLARPALQWTGKNVLPGVIVTTTALGCLSIGAEVYFRQTLKFSRAEISNPIMFVPDVGFTFTPGATIKWTDGFSFWTVTKVNSLGFADAEPALPKPKDTFRILIVGDSFVEALQVPLAEKLQTRLAERLREKYPDREVRRRSTRHGRIRSGQRTPVL
jgi:hypothetical protein